MNTTIRVMIDMETVATSPRAAIVSLGACTFGLPFGAERKIFYGKASLASNEHLKREISRETMLWWDKEENEAARLEAFSGTLALDDVLDQFLNWTDSIGNRVDIELWSRGAGFDCEILQDAFYQIFGSYPYDFRKHMCQRTVERLMPMTLKSAIPGNTYKHNALMDAMHQADVMDVALRNISWNGGMQTGWSA